MPYSVYIHIPFCRVRCAYCDFNTYAGLDKLIPDYVDALTREIHAVGAAARARGAGARRTVHTVFLGGGTPSLLPLSRLEEVFVALRSAFDILPEAEVTVEANPGTVDGDRLTGLRALGINRLSFGVQSAQPHELRLLDRLHTFEQAVEAMHLARRAGFANVNIDLIFGLMGQTMRSWQETLTRVLELEPEHLSLYALTLEHGTPMHAWVQRGLLPEPDPDLAADMYEWASERLQQSGFAQYEISNWARGDGLEPRLACRHNLQVWRHEPYLGFGAGAHGCTDGWRYNDVRSPRVYIRRMAQETRTDFPFSAALAARTRLDPETERREAVMLGMRLVREGVSGSAFARRFGVSLREHFARDWQELQSQGLVEWEGDRIRLTSRGRLLANQVFLRFV